MSDNKKYYEIWPQIIKNGEGHQSAKNRHAEHKPNADLSRDASM